MRINTITTLSLLSLTASAFPSPRSRDVKGQISVPFSKNLNSKARPKSLSATRKLLDSRAITAPLTNQLLYYTINVDIGTPPQSFSLVLDTGSSDVWVYAPESSASCSSCTTSYYDASASSTETTIDDLGVFNITYGTPNSGVTGYYAQDEVSVEGTSVQQIFGVATRANSGDPEGGIFGVGLSQGESIIRNDISPYPGYVDSLSNAGLIDVRGYSIFLNDITARDTATGTIIFGGTDSTKYTGDLVAFPLVIPAPDGVYRLDIAEPTISFSTGAASDQLPAVSSQYAVLLDTGTTISYIPAAQFAVLADTIGAQLADEQSGAYVAACSLADAAGGVDFAFSGPNGDKTITVPWQELIIADDSLPANTCLLGLAPLTQAQSYGLYILGDTFIRSSYLLFNFDDATISIAQAKYDHDQATESR